MAPHLRVGVLLLPTDPWPEAVARVRAIEALGYDHVWTYDHLTWRRYRERPWFAAIPWLTGLAASTERIRLGTLVASPNFRHPLTLAKEAATLDHVSGGRLTLGLGVGGIGFDATVFGEPPLTPPQRAARLEEFVAVLDRLLRDPEASHRGAHYTVDDAVMRPPCLQRPGCRSPSPPAGPPAGAGRPPRGHVGHLRRHVLPRHDAGRDRADRAGADGAAWRTSAQRSAGTRRRSPRRT